MHSSKRSKNSESFRDGLTFYVNICCGSPKYSTDYVCNSKCLVYNTLSKRHGLVVIPFQRPNFAFP
nr:hypothetical protein Iba_chr05cCG13480 [Ipomoea batatas]